MLVLVLVVITNCFITFAYNRLIHNNNNQQLLYLAALLYFMLMIEDPSWSGIHNNNIQLSNCKVKVLLKPNKTFSEGSSMSLTGCKVHCVCVYIMCVK